MFYSLPYFLKLTKPSPFTLFVIPEFACVLLGREREWKMECPWNNSHWWGARPGEQPCVVLLVSLIYWLHSSLRGWTCPCCSSGWVLRGSDLWSSSAPCLGISRHFNEEHSTNTPSPPLNRGCLVLAPKELCSFKKPWEVAMKQQESLAVLLGHTFQAHSWRVWEIPSTEIPLAGWLMTHEQRLHTEWFTHAAR